MGSTVAQWDSSVNHINRPLNEGVPACKAFGISWQPTSNNSVSLTLLRGQLGNNVVVEDLATHIPNSGVFFWTPSATLEADVALYLIQINDDVINQYSYSAQFGISKGPECNGMSTFPASASAT
ncbi:hypothetical protein EK21DRAFT_79960, partial [Setomelanomma holmii]